LTETLILLHKINTMHFIMGKIWTHLLEICSCILARWHNGSEHCSASFNSCI